MKKLLVVLVMLACAVGVYLRADSGDDVHGPVVVAKLALLDQSASISTTTIFTPTADGEYLLQYYLDSPTQDDNSGSSALIDVAYTDTHAHHIRNSMSVGASADTNPSNNGLAVLHLASGVPVQYFVTYNGGTTNYHYNLYVTLTKF